MRILKRLFGLEDNEQEEGDDVTDYTAIINSSKYADSNSNTEQLEKLLALVDIKKTDFDVAQECKKVSIESIICHDSDEVLPGQPTYKPAKFGKQGGQNFNLRKFDIPKWIYSAIANDNVSLLKLSNQMTMDNYVQRFQTLLWIEEAQQAIEMRRYDMYDVMLAKSEDFFVLDVPGLAENRPSLLRGDRLILRSDRRASYYEGYIYEVREKDILFKLHENLHSTAMDGLKFTVQFLTSRTPFRRCHHGVCQYSERFGISDMIFPTIPMNDKQLAPLVRIKVQNESELPCFMKCLNEYQRRAILNILKADNRPAPYIIFGPPGTGKTVTLVEAVLQVYARAKDFKILVCANSNSSTDLSAKLIQDSGVVPKEDMIRVSAFYRMEKLIPPELVDITKDMDMITTDMYENSRIIITTCIQSGSLYEFRDRFDYVFIDEAGHASEPEALIPIGLLNREGSCVLAGDPHQLGPICVSRVADQNGLGTSLLERLCRRSIYQRNVLRNNKMSYNERYITKLRICYRCDPRVLAINNKLFYDGDLKCVNETPKYWMDLFKVDKPLIFHGVEGHDRREFLNPSWFNPHESIRCLTYVKRLYDSGLKANQLGIITPYRRQIEKLNLLFDSCNLEKCKIATMEEFQGDEREIIIISTVRTRQKKLDFDKKFQLGFLFNPKRFNVAISRAKWLVIVVGDPRILGRDFYWTQYMDQAYKFDGNATSTTEQ